MGGGQKLKEQAISDKVCVEGIKKGKMQAVENLRIFETRFFGFAWAAPARQV